MARLPALLAAVALTLATAGCAENYGGVRPFWKAHDSVMQIQPGMTKDEVVKLAGMPVMTFKFERMQEEAWRYNYLEGQIHMRSWVKFGMSDNLVKSRTQEFDTDWYSVEGR